jgi:hypothetical protein
MYWTEVSKLVSSQLKESCKGVCEEKTWSEQLKSPLLETFTRERLVETEQTKKA